MTKVDGLYRAVKDHVRPSWRRVLNACVQLLDDGKPYSCANIGRIIGTTKQNVWLMQQRHPDMMRWVNRVLGEMTTHYTHAILRRHAFLGMQGSVPSAELVLKHEGGVYNRAAALGDMGDQGALPGGQQVVVNLLVPRPEYPQGAIVQAPTLRLPPPDLPPQLGGGR